MFEIPGGLVFAWETIRRSLVIPAQAGIQNSYMPQLSLDPGSRRGDETVVS